jgi:hypothetical protein
MRTLKSTFDITLGDQKEPVILIFSCYKTCLETGVRVNRSDWNIVLIRAVLQLRHPQYFVAQCGLLNPLMYKYNSFVSQTYYMQYSYDK